MINLKVLIDVVNFSTRAYIQKEENIIVPTQEMARIIYFESGGEYPTLLENIYDKLSMEDRKRADEIAQPINISGVRGTIKVKGD